MRKNDYLTMLFQDNETEVNPQKKELYEAVLECTVEALSQSDDGTECDQSIGLPELFAVILEAGKSAQRFDAGKGAKAQCVSPFRAAELIAQKLGVRYARPIDRMRAQFGEKAAGKPAKRLEDFL